MSNRERRVLKVGGRIASVGQRLLEASAKAIISQSLEGLHENIKIRAEHAAAHAPAAEPEPEPAPAPETAAAEAPKTEDKPAVETQAPAAAAPAPMAAAAAPAPAPAARTVPKPPLKRVSEADLAAAVAKEVSKNLVPMPVMLGLVFAAGVLAGWILKSIAAG